MSEQNNGSEQLTNERSEPNNGLGGLGGVGVGGTLSETLNKERKAALAYGLEQYQRMSQEREEAIRVRDELQVTVRGYRVAMEAQDARILDLESRNSSLTIERDAAVAHRTKWEALFTSVLAQLRAFEVPNEPLIKDRTQDHLLDLVRAQQNFKPHDDPLTVLQRLAASQ